MFVCGKVDGLMMISGRRHNTDDIIATVLAVEPMKFIYRGRIAVFSIKVLKDERIIIIAEQRPEATEEEVREKCKLVRNSNPTECEQILLESGKQWTKDILLSVLNTTLGVLL